MQKRYLIKWQLKIKESNKSHGKVRLGCQRLIETIKLLIKIIFLGIARPAHNEKLKFIHLQSVVVGRAIDGWPACHSLDMLKRFLKKETHKLVRLCCWNEKETRAGKNFYNSTNSSNLCNKLLLFGLLWSLNWKLPSEFN